MNKKVEELPCPFCGSKNVMAIFNPEKNRSCVECNNCHANGPLKEDEPPYQGSSHKLGNKARRAWNDRK